MSARPVPAAKQRIILASLLLRAGQIVSTLELAEHIWDDDLPAGARKLVQGYVMRLRHTLGPKVGALIVPRSPGYLIDINEAEFDVRELRDALAAGRTAAERRDWQTAAVQLRRAVAQFRGQPLLDVPSAALHRNHVPHLIELGIEAHEALTDAEIHLDQLQAAATRLAELAAAHPNRESLHLRMMTVLDHLGRRAEALDVYRRLRRSLVKDLGIEPSPDVQALHRRLLQSGTATTHIEHEPNPPRLPLTARGFSGRTAELRRLNDLIAVSNQDSKAVPVVVLSGMGGVGKTALALHWAHQISDDFPDGQIYLDLRGHSEHDQVTPAEALAAMLQALGSRPEQVPADPAAAAGLYRARVAGRRLLLLLDNARSTEQIRWLLPGDHRCAVIVTSRYRLTELQVHDGALSMDLDALRPTDAEQVLNTLLGERVREEPDVVVEIARLCAYLPLALRIAAARLAEKPERGITWLRDELSGGDRLSALEMNGDKEVAVRAVFDLSYRHLPAAARRLFTLLGLVPGTHFSVEAVAALADLSRPAAQRVLGQLTAAHMVRARASGRYDFHDLIREYARSLAAESDERAVAYDRLYAWYCHFSEATTRMLYPQSRRLRPPFHHDASAAVGPRLSDAAQAKAWLDHEFGQLSAAIRHGVNNGQTEATIHLSDILRGYLLSHSSLNDWLTIADAAMTAAHVAGDMRAEAAAHMSAGTAYGSRDEYQSAIKHLESGYDLAQRSGWVTGAMLAQLNLGLVYTLTGALALGHSAYLRVLDTGARSGEDALTETARSNIGHVFIDIGQPMEAISWIAKELVRPGQFQIQTQTANALDCLGLAYCQVGNFELARQQLTQALELAHKFGDTGLEAITLAHLSTVAINQGNHDEARTLTRQAVEVARIVGRPRIEALALNALAFLLVSDGDGVGARRTASHAYDLASTIGCRGIEIEALINLALAHQLLGDIEPATDAATRARDLADASGYLALAHRCVDILDKLSCEDTETHVWAGSGHNSSGIAESINSDDQRPEEGTGG